MRDYWGFPAILETFKATGYGKIQNIDGLEWRVRGGDYVLLTPPQELFTVPEEANPSRIRSLCFLEGTLGEEIPAKAGSNTWMYGIGDDWEPNKKGRYALRQAERAGACLMTPSPEQTLEVFTEWLRWAKTRKDMVVRGHYEQMITHPGFTFLGTQVDGEVISVCGFTQEGEDSAIAFAKHREGPWWVARHMWVTALLRLLESGATSINCGDTADKLKQQLGLKKFRQSRVDFSQL